MPKSRIRKKTAYTPPPEPTSRTAKYSPAWLAPLMVVCFVVGIAWLVAYYLTQGDFPVPGIGAGNLGVGFGFILVGFGLSTQWR